jgi:heme oxygenase
MISLSLIQQPNKNHVQRILLSEHDESLFWGKADYVPEFYGTISRRIEAEVAEAYDRLTCTIASADPVANLENYKRYLAMQFGFQIQIEPLYFDPVIRRTCLALSGKGHAELIRLDLSELKWRMASGIYAKPNLPGGLMQRLGWLFVAGLFQRDAKSLLNLAKNLQLDEKYGARYATANLNLAEQRWAELTTVLDGLNVSEVEEERIYSGARSALSFVGKEATAAFVEKRPGNWSGK